MASLRCHGDSDCYKTQTRKKFSSLYNAVVVIFFPYLYSWRRIVNISERKGKENNNNDKTSPMTIIIITKNLLLIYNSKYLF